MRPIANNRASEARAELEAWYVGWLLPKLTRAAGRGVVDGAAVEALHADVRALLDISQERKDAA